MKNEIKKCQEFLAALEVVSDAAEEWGTRVVNNKFSDFVENKLDERGITAKARISKENNNTSFRVWLVNYPQDNVLDIRWCEILHVIANRRINFVEFNKFLNTRREFMTSEITRLEEDLETGEARLKEYNELVSKLSALGKTFSLRFREINQYRFDKLYV